MEERVNCGNETEKEELFYENGALSLDLGLAASVSPGELSETHILSPTSDLLNQGPQGWTSYSVLTGPPMVLFLTQVQV
jgi:hypothetical protein